MVALAAINGGNTSSNTSSTQGVGSVYTPGYPGQLGNTVYGNFTIPGYGVAGPSDLAAILNYLLNRNLTISFRGSNISISKTSISGSLALVANSVAYIQRDSDVARVIIPIRLFDGERTLYLDEAIFLGYLGRGDPVSISAINITITPASGGNVTSIYVALEIQDTATGKRLTIDIPISIS